MAARVIQWEKHIHLQSVESTNNYIRRGEVPAGSWVTADEQTQGRGRGQHTWKAIGAERLIFSAKVEFDSIPAPTLPVRIGGAVLRACRSLNLADADSLQLKWPNDIFRDRKKIGGILLEAESGKSHILIIGVGINISGTKLPPDLPDAGFLSDVAVPGADVRLSRAIIAEINTVLNDAGNADACRAELDWIEKNSFLRGKKIRAKSERGVVAGRVQGIADQGYLRLIGDGDRELLLSDAASEIKIIAG